MKWINFLHCYQPANSDSYKINQAVDLNYNRVVKALIDNPSAKFTINISGCLVLRLIELNHYELIDKINFLIDRGQIELTGSSAYHWLLPMFDKSKVEEQIKENEEILKKYFPTAKLRGFFLPEMAYSSEVAKVIKKMGYSWMILDEISISSNKKINLTDIYLDKNSDLKIIFRSRLYSNHYPPEKVLELAKLNKKTTVITATDGELYGLKHNDLNHKLEESLKNKKIETQLISDYIASFKKNKIIDIRSSNWESREEDLNRDCPYALWFDKKNNIQNDLWKITKMALYLHDKYKKDSNYYWSHWYLLRGLASCTFWWASGYKFENNFNFIAWGPDEVERGLGDIIRSIRSLENSTSYREKIRAENIFHSVKKKIWFKHWSYYYNNRLEDTSKNKINKLCNEKYAFDYLSKKILSAYPEFEKINKIKIIYHKKNIWSTSYHVVLEFKVSFVSKLNDKKSNKNVRSIFCTAHSDEPRKNVNDALKYLWKQNFSTTSLTIPKPLFYSKYFNASFYEGVTGRSLLTYIKKEDKIEIEKNIKRIAIWLFRLHSIPIKKSANFNEKNNNIKTVIPGYYNIFKEVKKRYNGKYLLDLKMIYDYLIKQEKKFFSNTKKKWLIHGDVHPDNIIRISDKKIAMIDFADICQSDFARDLGTFLQQLDYRLYRFRYDEKYIKTMKDLFIETYCQKAEIKYDSNLKDRIDLYYNWTAVRTVVFWLLQHNANPDRAEELLFQVKKIIK
jgi:thiamine kinase-like enzyme